MSPDKEKVAIKRYNDKKKKKKKTKLSPKTKLSKIPEIELRDPALEEYYSIKR